MTTYKLKQTDVVRIEDEFGHSYEIDGQPVVGVTTILQLGVPADKGLLEYFKNNSREAQEDILIDAQERGTNVHQAIEKLINGEKVDLTQFKREREKKGIAAFVDWYQKVAPTEMEPERVVAYVMPRTVSTSNNNSEDVIKFAGTLDLVCTINGKRVLMDFKTSAVHSKKNCLQVEAYKKAYEQSTGETIDEAYILYLGTSHKGTRPKEIDGMPSTGFGWSMVKSEDTFDDFLRAYDMAIWAEGGYPKPPKKIVYPAFVTLNNNKEEK